MSKPYELRESDEAGDYRCYVVRTSDGYELGWDHGEPEDNTFTRDYDWVVPELNAAYARGLEGAAAEVERLRAALTSIHDDVSGPALEHGGMFWDRWCDSIAKRVRAALEETKR